MKINLTEHWESKLETQLLEFENSIGSNDVIHPENEWGQESAPIHGVINGNWANKTIFLTNKSFEKGSIRVLVPCKLVLCESIQFNPNSGLNKDGNLISYKERENDWFPKHDQEAYFTPTKQQRHGDSPSNAFRLGFFAAITIEHTQGTIIDLNGFTLACSPIFALQQRFHALIELANQPFITNQGPAQFGENIRSAAKVWIKNGTIGRSSHHGIHGNGMRDVIISDLTFSDFEVAAISLNGGKRILIQDCQVKGTSKKVPVLGSYSTGRFLKLIAGEYIRHLKEIKESDESLNTLVVTLSNKLDFLNKELEVAEECVLTDKLELVPPIFKNPSFENPETKKLEYLPDANPYGVALHSKGVMVNAFLCAGAKLTGLNDLSKLYETSDVTIRRTNISNIRGNVREVLGMGLINDSNSLPDPIADTAGSLFRFFPILAQGMKLSDKQEAEMDENGHPKLTVIGQVQIALAKIEQFIAKSANSKIKKLNRNLAEKLISLIPWAEGKMGNFKQSEDRKFIWNLGDKEFRLFSNGDSMFHVNKGSLGLFLQAIDGLNLDRVNVTVVENKGLPGSDCAGNYRDSSNGGHKLQNQQLGYTGANSKGIYIGACSNVMADRIQAHGVVSDYGSSVGIEIAGGSEHVSLLSPVVGIVESGRNFNKEYRKVSEENKISTFQTRFPNTPPIANGLLVDETTRNIGIEDYQNIGKIESPIEEFPAKIRIHSRLNSLNS